MHRHLPLTAELRRARYAGWLAVCLILIQVLAAAEHLSAKAAAAVSSENPLGFLSICSARGALPTPVPADGAPSAAVAGACALCAMDATAGQAILAEASPQPAPPCVLSDRVVVIDAQANPTPARRYGAVRGPPLLPC